MKATVKFLLRLRQIHFRSLVYQARARQLRERDLMHRQLAQEWQAKLAEIGHWRSWCDAHTCPECGGAKGHPGRQLPCLCNARTPPTPAQLTQMLRKLAGINNGHATPRNEWSGWNDGRRGPKLCGPESWDIAVRIYEEG